MKILYHHRIASKDGQYVHIEELTSALKKLGHEIIIVGPSIIETDDFGAEGGFVSLLKRYIPVFLYEILELGYSLIAYFKLQRAVKEHNPDCLYERYNLYMLAGYWIKSRFRLPLLLEVNAPLFQERQKFTGVALPRLAKWAENTVWKAADRVLPVTQVLADIVQKAGVSKQRIEVIHNGIDLEKFGELIDKDSIRKLGLENKGLDNKLVLGFTGFMREWHKLDRVVDVVAASKRHDRHLLIVGDGPARQAVQSRAKKLGVSDCVTITGIVNRDKIAAYVSSFDIALQPDVVEYASPLKIFEYLALARAIIAPDSPNIKEILTHNKNALLFDPADPDAFVHCIEQLCDDVDLRKRLALAAKETITERKFTWENNAKRVVALFEILGARSN